MAATRIDILTHHWVPNFGANLQAFASSRALSQYGAEVRFCNFRSREMEARYRAIVPEVQWRAHDAFTTQSFNQSELIRTQAEFVDFCEESSADIYISGSDAVFRLKPGTTRADWDFPNPFWLVGVNSRSPGRQPRKIALAASAMGCQFGRLDRDKRIHLRVAVESMDEVSVRDLWTLGQLRSLGVRKEIQLVPDPVLSLRELIIEMRVSASNTRPYIVVSTGGCVSHAWIQDFTRLCETSGYETVALPLPEDLVDSPVSRSVPLPLDPLDWLRTMAVADGYVGVRFHPTLCSLIAGVPVVSLDRYHRLAIDARKSKTVELMRQFGAQQYCFGRWATRVLSPAKVFSLLQEQQLELAGRKEMAAELEVVFREFLRKFMQQG